MNESDFIEAVSQRWGGNQAWHVIGDSWQGINVGGGESLFEMGLSHVDLQTKGFSLEHIFFSDGPTSKGREFFKIACHNNVIDIVTH